ncbi:MAG: hypothetical protein QM743_01930 [Chitinophagaceae bacterium]
MGHFCGRLKCRRVLQQGVVGTFAGANGCRQQQGSEGIDGFGDERAGGLAISQSRRRGAAIRPRATAIISACATRRVLSATGPIRGPFSKSWRNCALLYRKAGEDPLGEEATEEIKRKQIDEMLTGDDLNSAALVHGALEEFARSLSGSSAASCELPPGGAPSGSSSAEVFGKAA